MIEVKLTQGKVALIDDEDFSKISDFSWYVKVSNKKYWYACTDSNGSTLYLHKFVLNLHDSKQLVDHINHNTLDNQKSNLRVANKSQNNRNSNLFSNNTVGYKGVGWHKEHKRYQAGIYQNNKRIHLGYFNNPIDAAKAYDEAAIRIGGEFALTNKQLGLL